VANFNNGSVQGTGSTIMQVKQSGAAASVFFQGSPGLGLTTALGALKSGFVLVGSLPTTDGTCNTIGHTALLIVNRQGQLDTTLSDAKLLDGPWDLTVYETGNHAIVFVSNVLTGTVTRLNVKALGNGKLTVEGMTQIASGYTAACNAAAVVVGPTGLAYDSNRDVLYVASTGDNEIFAISGAGGTKVDNGRGTLIYSDAAHLHGPLGLALAPNGHLITANGDAVFEPPGTPNEIVEFTTAGQFVSEFQIDPGPAGAAFGLAVERNNGMIVFAAVNDDLAVLDEWREK
jgi:DNA-binding beta-propeller fold protein YncE